MLPDLFDTVHTCQTNIKVHFYKRMNAKIPQLWRHSVQFYAVSETATQHGEVLRIVRHPGLEIDRPIAMILVFVIVFVAILLDWIMV